MQIIHGWQLRRFYKTQSLIDKRICNNKTVNISKAHVYRALLCVKILFL